MSNQAFFELSSSLLSPKHVGLSPFHAKDEERLSTAPPRVSTALYGYTMCVKRALNTRIIGFCEPTLQQCVNSLVTDVKASAMGGEDPQALADTLRRRRGEVDVASLPWAPRPEYVRWLQRHGRLADGAATTSSADQ